MAQNAMRYLYFVPEMRGDLKGDLLHGTSFSHATAYAGHDYNTNCVVVITLPHPYDRRARMLMVLSNVVGLT